MGLGRTIFSIWVPGFFFQSKYVKMQPSNTSRSPTAGNSQASFMEMPVEERSEAPFQDSQSDSCGAASCTHLPTGRRGGRRTGKQMHTRGLAEHRTSSGPGICQKDDVGDPIGRGVRTAIIPFPQCRVFQGSVPALNTMPDSLQVPRVLRRPVRQLAQVNLILSRRKRGQEKRRFENSSSECFLSWQLTVLFR